MKFDLSNKFDLYYYWQVKSLILKSSVVWKRASKHFWVKHLFCWRWYIFVYLRCYRSRMWVFLRGVLQFFRFCVTELSQLVMLWCPTLEVILMYVDITDVPHNYYEFEEVDQCMDINNSLIIFHHIIRSFGCNFNQLVVEMEQKKTKLVISVDRNVVWWSDMWWYWWICCISCVYIREKLCLCAYFGGTAICCYVWLRIYQWCNQGMFCRNSSHDRKP